MPIRLPRKVLQIRVVRWWSKKKCRRRILLLKGEGGPKGRMRGEETTFLYPSPFRRGCGIQVSDLPKGLRKRVFYFGKFWSLKLPGFCRGASVQLFDNPSAIVHGTSCASSNGSIRRVVTKGVRNSSKGGANEFRDARSKVYLLFRGMDRKKGPGVWPLFF